MTWPRDRVCLITGATRGIGRATALELAARGMRLVLVARDRSRGDATRDHIRHTVPAAEVDVFIADLSLQSSIRQLAGEVLTRHPRIDVLLNNAGVFPGPRSVTAEGIELTLAVNHLSYFLLTRLLEPRLRQNPLGRIVNVASGAHFRARLDLDDLGLERGYSPRRAYANSKLMNVLWSRELAVRLDGSGVTSNCLHPGVVKTGLLERYVRNSGRLAWFLKPLLDLLFIDEAEGARTSVHLAASPDLEAVSGLYFKRERPTAISRAAANAVTGVELWRRSEAMLR